MKNYIIRLEDAYEALSDHNGRLVPAAEALRVPLHSLKSFIECNAELQAICANRHIEIVDRATDDILAVQRDANITASERTALAKWVLEKAASDIYSPRAQVDLDKGKSLKDMSEEDLIALIKASPDMPELLKKALDV